jgi:hypothetical protein
MIAMNSIAISAGVLNKPTQHDSEENLENERPHSLDEIQRRAVRIHRRHGGIYGGYTLEEWLEAEHELEDEDHSVPDKKDRVH